MTTQDIARQDAASGALATFAPTPSEAISAALEQWVGGVAASVRGAEYIVDTPMCPDSFWPLPAGVTSSKAPKQLVGSEDRESFLARRQVAAYTLGAVVRYGLQLGLPPEVAVQGIFPIGGRMSMYAEQMVALVKSHGHGHRVIERTRERCIVEVCRRGTDEWHRFEFTFADAVAAGYVPNQGPNDKDHGLWPSGDAKKSPGNEKYLTDPATMLYARVSSIACRIEFPDVLRGLTSYEDVLDEQRVTAVASDLEPARAEVRREAERTSAAAILARAEQATPVAVSEPDSGAAQVRMSEAAPSVPAEPEVHRYVMPISKAQGELIKAAFEKHGYGGRANAVRDQRMAVVSKLIGKPISDPRELTGDEARIIIDHIGPDSGAQVIAEILDPGHLEDAAGTQEAETGETYDPTTEAGWARDEAAAEQ